MYEQDIFCGISNVPFEITHAVSYPYIERCAFYFICRWKFAQQWPVTRKIFPFDDVIMCMHFHLEDQLGLRAPAGPLYVVKSMALWG